MNTDSMIPVFVPREFGLRSISELAAAHDCRLIVSRSGALVLEPRTSAVSSSVVVRFPVPVHQAGTSS
jgi:hypothetical protein